MTAAPRAAEVLAPAGSPAALLAALQNGADAVYFGLQDGFNARARAANFALADLPATVADVHRAGARVVTAGSASIAVFRTGTDEVFALNDRCPHKGGPLSQGIVFGRRVACPLHNWAIELESGNAVAPDEGCAGTWPAKVEAGEVWLRVPALASAEGGVA